MPNHEGLPRWQRRSAGAKRGESDNQWAALQAETTKLVHNNRVFGRRYTNAMKRANRLQAKLASLSDENPSTRAVMHLEATGRRLRETNQRLEKRQQSLRHDLLRQTEVAQQATAHAKCLERVLVTAGVPFTPCTAPAETTPGGLPRR